MSQNLKQQDRSPACDNHASAAHLDSRGYYLMHPSKLNAGSAERRRKPRRMLGEGG